MFGLRLFLADPLNHAQSKISLIRIVLLHARLLFTRLELLGHVYHLVQFHTVLSTCVNADRLRYQIESSFQVVKDRSTPEEICIICPVPGCQDKTGNRYLNVKTLLTHCYRCEGKSVGHIRSLFKIVGVVFDDDQAMEPEQLKDMMRGPVKKALTPVQNVDLPEGFSLLRKNRESCYWQFCKEMAERKNLGIEDLEQTDAGFTREGDWEPFCIFPVYENGRTVYYQGRTYLDDGFDKTKKFPSKHKVPYGASYWIHNIDALSGKDVRLVIVVESILNELSLKREIAKIGEEGKIVPVCVFTHKITTAQFAKMRRFPAIKEWCLLFDSDSTRDADLTAQELSSVLPVTVAEMPHGINQDGSVRKTNDANDDVKAALQAISTRRLVNKSIVLASKHNKPRRRSLAEIDEERKQNQLSSL